MHSFQALAAAVGALREEYEGKMQAAQEEQEARVAVRQMTTKRSLNPTMPLLPSHCAFHLFLQN